MKLSRFASPSSFVCSLPWFASVIDWLRSKLALRQRDAGEVARLQRLLAHEIALHHETLQALDAARAETARAQQIRTEFLAVMTHELRTPLTSIIGYGELMQRDLAAHTNRQLQHDVDRILASSGHLLGLIDNMLELGDLEAGRVDCAYRDVNVVDMVRDLVNELQLLASRNGNSFRVSFDESAYRMRSDAVKLQHILYHVMHNAVKFTSHGVVSVRVTGMGSWICFQVADTGIGIDPACQRTLFEAFTIGDSSSTRNYGGAGVGLALSYRLCQLLQGQIDVVSQPGAGSTFTIRIPRSLPHSS